MSMSRGSAYAGSAGNGPLPRRVEKETQRFSRDPAPGVSIRPHEQNPRYFAIKIQGPSDTPYEGGVFQLELFLPSAYPMKPPKVRFLTRIYHPNVDRLGRICLNILKDKWSPALQIRHVCLSIQALLQSPEPNDPLALDVAELWRKDERKALQNARQWTVRYAMPQR